VENLSGSAIPANNPADHVSTRGLLAHVFNLSVDKAEQAIRQGVGFVDVVRYVKGGNTGAPADVVQQSTHLMAGLVVQSAQRFVKTQHAWPKRKGPAQRHALALASAKATRFAMQQVRNV